MLDPVLKHIVEEQKYKSHFNYIGSLYKVIVIEEQIYTARLNNRNKTNSTVKGQDITSETKETHSDRTQHEPTQKLEVKSGAPEG